MADLSKRKVLIVGGHMTPAFAVLSSMRNRGLRKFLWVGHKYNQKGNKVPSGEYLTVIDKGIPFINLHTGKLVRNIFSDPFGFIFNLLKIPFGLFHAFWVILYFRPDLIMSFGGYLAVPITIWGKLFGAKILTHEQTVTVGLANRIIALFANRILITWPDSAKYFPAHTTIHVGNPIREEILNARSFAFEFDNNLPVVYITGGNQGAHVINEAVFNGLDVLLQNVNIIHQTGSSSVTKDYERAQKVKNELSPELRDRYYFRNYVYPEEIGEIFAKADLIISRAGANIVYEILAMQKLSILIPIPWVTRNEQMLNAEMAAATGLGMILKEDELNEQSLVDRVKLGLIQLKQQEGFDGENIELAKTKAHELITLDAAHRIGEIVTELLR